MKPTKIKPTKAILHSLYGTHDFKQFDDAPDYTPPPKPTKRKRSPFKSYEDTLQKQIVKWFRLQYPDMTQLLCYNNNNSKDMIRQVIDKSLGLVTGRNDLTLYYRGRALLLELKAKGGKQSEAQIEFERTATKYGNHYRLADDFDQATDIIRKFITWADTQ